jgi:hypothetical protein
MLITLTPDYSKEFKEAYKDFIYPLKGYLFQTIDTEDFNMPIPRIGEKITSFPIHSGDDAELFDLVVTEVIYEILHDSEGSFIEDMDIGQTYEEHQSRVTVYFTEYKPYKLADPN